MTLAAAEAYGVEQMIAELEEAVRAGIYRPKPVRWVEIPEPDGSKRPLGIPTAKGRVCQQAAKIVLEPIFEADFLRCSSAFRPKWPATDAMEKIRVGFIEGKCFVSEADIRDFFNRLGFGLILGCLRERVSDRKVLRLVRTILEAGAPGGEVLPHPGEGAPQGGPPSPLLADAVLHRRDRAWQLRHRRLGPERLTGTIDFGRSARAAGSKVGACRR
ncbi:MAG: reverse transcriptase domain-containing protein [Actinomycetota bacterium]|nr:reverse transcriptase domain-containing protein [Actinomycetota bacterium]